MNTIYQGTRPNWNEYFINIAAAVAKRATCPRAQVGAILVDDFRIIATGYNGALPGKDHCEDIGCQLTNGRHCTRAIHAEANVVYQAAKNGIATYGSILYFWDSRNRPHPCDACMPQIVSVGIRMVINKDKEVFHVNEWPYL